MRVGIVDVAVAEADTDVREADERGRKMGEKVGENWKCEVVEDLAGVRNARNAVPPVDIAQRDYKRLHLGQSVVENDIVAVSCSE